MVTGGAAQVFVTAEPEELSVEEPITFHIKAITKDAEVKINKVYLKLKAVETVEIEYIETEIEDGEIERERERVHRSITTHEEEFVVSGPETLEPEQEYNWSIEINLPERVNPSFYGEMARHEWKVFAGLDAFGNDPDSGWEKVDIW